MQPLPNMLQNDVKQSISLCGKQMRPRFSGYEILFLQIFHHFEMKFQADPGWQSLEAQKPALINGSEAPVAEAWFWHEVFFKIDVLVEDVEGCI